MLRRWDSAGRVPGGLDVWPLARPEAVGCLDDSKRPPKKGPGQALQQDRGCHWPGVEATGRPPWPGNNKPALHVHGVLSCNRLLGHDNMHLHTPLGKLIFTSLPGLNFMVVDSFPPQRHQSRTSPLFHPDPLPQPLLLNPAYNPPTASVFLSRFLNSVASSSRRLRSRPSLHTTPLSHLGF